MNPGRPDFRRHIVLAFGLVAAVGLSTCLIVYSLRKRPPDVPTDPDHIRSVTSPQCLSCHGPLEAYPRSRNHPLNDQCFNCHERT